MSAVDVFGWWRSGVFFESPGATSPYLMTRKCSGAPRALGVSITAGEGPVCRLPFVGAHAQANSTSATSAPSTFEALQLLAFGQWTVHESVPSTSVRMSRDEMADLESTVLLRVLPAWSSDTESTTLRWPTYPNSSKRQLEQNGSTGSTR